MLFPESSRVIYKKNPLDEVICQVRFPTILRIDSDLVGFQERIRKRYPNYRERSGDSSLPIPVELLNQLPVELRDPFIGSGNKTYDFGSEDNKWTVSLNREFLALTTTDYLRWEDFHAHLDETIRTLIQEYSPAFFSRVGLRYQNVIRRSMLGLADYGWSSLLEQHIAGVLGVQEENIINSVRETVGHVLFESEMGQIRIQYGLVKDRTTQESCYLIDSDFFTTRRTEISDVFTILDEFNKQNRRLFRWCITDRLHSAMEPQSV